MLISYLCKWLGVRLITLDIHGGTTENDIVAVFEEAKAHLEALRIAKDGKCLSIRKKQFVDSANDVYIFLDEVNTCAHMGVIAEAICHRTINGARLAEGIKILAALNPYREKPDLSDGIDTGLEYRSRDHAAKSRKNRLFNKKSDEDLMKRLVYRVHPIPKLLQDFIFDFGGISIIETKVLSYTS